VALSIIKRIFSNFGLSSVFSISFLGVNGIGVSRNNLFILGVSIIMLFLANVMQYKFNVRNELAKQNFLFRWCCYYFIVLFIITFGIYSSEYTQTQFIYFQF
jgi:hypothetical protein